MIFSNPAEIAQTIRANASRKMLDKAKELRVVRSAHVTGRELKKLIKHMDYFEDDQRKNLRQAYARSNKDLFSRILRPIDKVFSAKGGSVILNVESENLQKRMNDTLENVRAGYGVRDWVQTFAAKAFVVDPLSLVFMEVDETGNTYPTYKSVACIYDIALTGRRPEYVVFSLDEDDIEALKKKGVIPETVENEKAKHFRVVDDAADMIVEYVDGEPTGNAAASATILESIPNVFDKLPALVVSDLQEFDTSYFISPIDDIIEVANDFLTDNSVFSIFKKLHGFPKSWRFRTLCESCMGTKYVDGESCKSCNGTGYKKKMTVRDEIIAPIPEQGQPVISQFAGYTVPPIDAWGKMVEEMERLESVMTVTLWGADTERAGAQARVSGGDRNTLSKTATQSFMDVAPVNDRLKDFSCWAESVETFIVNHIGKVIVGATYPGAGIAYGDRYMLEKSDAIWEKYKNARTSGAPQSTLDGLLKDYYESRYQGAGLEYQKAINMMAVEPWVHLTAQQLLTTKPAEQDYLAKLYFSEWISTKNDIYLVSTDVQAMRDDLYAFAAQKQASVDADREKQAKLDASAQQKPGGFPGKE